MGEEEEEEEEEEKGESSSSWYGYGQRHFIVLAGLGGILGVTIVVMVISIVLRPAYVEFTVVDTMMKRFDQGDGLILNLTVNATTTSGRGRAKARYKSVFVDLVVANINSDSRQACDNSARNGSTTSTSSAALTLHATVDSAPATTEEDLPQSFNASLVLEEGPLVSLVEANDTDVEFTVVVTALVSFHIGPVPTRVYHVAVRCPHVKFPSTTPVNCPH